MSAVGMPVKMESGLRVPKVGEGQQVRALDRERKERKSVVRTQSPACVDHEPGKKLSADIVSRRDLVFVATRAGEQAQRGKKK